jgi:hypothetical protein
MRRYLKIKEKQEREDRDRDRERQSDGKTERDRERWREMEEAIERERESHTIQRQSETLRDVHTVLQTETKKKTYRQRQKKLIFSICVLKFINCLEKC